MGYNLSKNFSSGREFIFCGTYVEDESHFESATVKSDANENLSDKFVFSLFILYFLFSLPHFICGIYVEYESHFDSATVKSDAN